MYLFCPIGDYKEELIRKYSGFFKKVLHSHSSILISSMVVSEFFNAYTRLEFNIRQRKEPKKYKNYKNDFRGTDEYQMLVEQIKKTINTRILNLSFSKRISDKFDTINLDKVFDGIEKKDFNDNYYKTLAFMEDFKIVTHDYDFVFPKEESASILTANAKILSKYTKTIKKIDLSNYSFNYN